MQFVRGPAVGHLVLAPEHHCVARSGLAQQISAKLIWASGKNSRPASVAVDQSAAALFADHAAIVPDLVPEQVRMRDRPGMEVLVGCLDAEAVPGIDLPQEIHDLGRGRALRARHP